MALPTSKVGSINPGLLGSIGDVKPLETFDEVMSAFDKGYLRGGQLMDDVLNKPGRDALGRETVDAQRQALADLEEVRPLSNEVRQRTLAGQSVELRNKAELASSVFEAEKQRMKLEEEARKIAEQKQKVEKFIVAQELKYQENPSEKTFKDAWQKLQDKYFDLTGSTYENDDPSIRKPQEQLKNFAAEVRRLAAEDDERQFAKKLDQETRLAQAKNAVSPETKSEQVQRVDPATGDTYESTRIFDPRTGRTISQTEEVVSKSGKMTEGKVLNASEVQILQALDQAELDLATLEKMFATAGTNFGGPVSGRLKNYAGGLDTTTAAINNARNAAAPNLARGVFREVGVLTDLDIKRYTDLLPSPTDTPGLRAQKFAQLKQRLEEGRTLNRENLKKAGRDMSEFGSPASKAPSGNVVVRTQEEWAALPPGTAYQDINGNAGIKK